MAIKHRRLFFDLREVDFNKLNALNDFKVKVKGDVITAFVPVERAQEILKRVGEGAQPLKNLKRTNSTKPL